MAPCFVLPSEVVTVVSLPVDGIAADAIFRERLTNLANDARFAELTAGLRSRRMSELVRFSNNHHDRADCAVRPLTRPPCEAPTTPTATGDQ